MQNLQEAQSPQALPSFLDLAVQESFKNIFILNESNVSLVNNLQQGVNILASLIILGYFISRFAANIRTNLTEASGQIKVFTLYDGLYILISLISIWAFPVIMYNIEGYLLTLFNGQKYIGFDNQIIDSLKNSITRIHTTIALQKYGDAVKNALDITIFESNLKGIGATLVDTLIPKGYVLFFLIVDFAMQFASYLLLFFVYLEKSIILLLLNLFYPVVLVLSLLSGAAKKDPDAADNLIYFRKYITKIAMVILFFPVMVLVFSFVDNIQFVLKTKLVSSVVANTYTVAQTEVSSAMQYFNSGLATIPNRSDSTNTAEYAQIKNANAALSEFGNFLTTNTAVVLDTLVWANDISLIWSIPISALFLIFKYKLSTIVWKWLEYIFKGKT